MKSELKTKARLVVLLDAIEEDEDNESISGDLFQTRGW